MGFEKFGRKSYTAETKVAEFVERLERGEIAATRCLGCGRVSFPPRADCAGCLGDSFEWVPVTGAGRLVSFTRVNYAPAGFEEDVPYTLALVDFGEVKVFGRLSGSVPEEAVRVGAMFRPAVCRLPDGQIAYEFLPA